ncbi:MAG: serine/threonine-protein kinase [Vulcanimicrobiota bacterium]
MSKLAAWGLILTGLALAQPASQSSRLAELQRDPPRSLNFKVWPRDAALFYANQQPVERGLDGGFILERPRSDLGAADRLDCEFRSSGFAPVQLSLNWADIVNWSQAGGNYPEPIALQPQSPSAYLRAYPWLGLPLGAAPLILLGLGWRWKKNQRILALERRLQQLVPTSARQFDPLLGLSVGRYRLIRKLGEGGMAGVYAAYPAADLDESQAVALKLLRLELNHEKLRRQFEQEIALSIQLDHPNIVRVIDWGWQENRAYLVMELLEGTPLSRRIPATGMQLEEVGRLLKAWAAALSYAHERQIIHRDVKPDNAFVTRSGLLKLLDFGLACENAEGMGTPGYMAPEQAAGQTVGPAADQYALGASLYQMLCGRRPFQADDPLQELRNQAIQNPPSIRQLRPDLDEKIDQAIRRMLARRPEERFESINQACLALFS